MIVLVDYGLGNLGSVANMLRKVTDQEIAISAEPQTIQKAAKLILPGVGHFDRGSKNLYSSGLAGVLTEKVEGAKTPILGICLGMQLMSEGSDEGTEPGLSWIKGRFKRFQFTNGEAAKLKIPHMGWNFLNVKKPSGLLDGLPENPRFYFVHSYHFLPGNADDVLTTTEYGYEFGSAFQSGNICGVQFHPEKSHRFGMKLLDNFVNRI